MKMINSISILIGDVQCLKIFGKTVSLILFIVTWLKLSTNLASLRNSKECLIFNFFKLLQERRTHLIISIQSELKNTFSASFPLYEK